MPPLYTVALAVLAISTGSLLAWLIAALIRWSVTRAGTIARLRAEQLTAQEEEGRWKLRAQAELDAALEEQEHWKLQFTEEARKRKEVTAFIESIQAERDTWKNLYLRAGREHGVAQDLMMKQIDRLGRITKREAPDEPKTMADAYRAEHGTAATLKMAERIERARLPAPAPDPVATDDSNAYSAKP